MLHHLIAGIGFMDWSFDNGVVVAIGNPTAINVMIKIRFLL